MSLVPAVLVCELQVPLDVLRTALQTNTGRAYCHARALESCRPWWGSDHAVATASFESAQVGERSVALLERSELLSTRYRATESGRAVSRTPGF